METLYCTMKKENKSFWLTNISNRNVSLSDLNLTIKSMSSVNLLDSKHYKYTLEELQKSLNSGSVYSKRDKIFKRDFAPNSVQSKMSIVHESFIPSRERSVFVVKEEKYDELEISNQFVADEKFAEENIEIVELDNVPIKSKDKK